MLFKVIAIAFVTVVLYGTASAQTQLQPAITAAAQTTSKREVKYGSNPAAGKIFTHDGVNLYYEVYGVGEPVLLVHGNGGNIASLKAQIEYFRKHYKVIAMDSRDQGRSADSPDDITYEKMTDDLAALLDRLQTGERALHRPALTRSEMRTRSCLATVAMTAITASLKIPQLSKYCSVKLR